MRITHAILSISLLALAACSKANAATADARHEQPLGATLLATL